MTVLAHANWIPKVFLQDYFMSTHAYGSSKMEENVEKAHSVYDDAADIARDALYLRLRIFSCQIFPIVSGLVK